MHVTYVREESQRIQCGWYRGSSDYPVPEYEKVFRGFFIAMYIKNNPEYEVDKAKHILGGL